VADASAVPVAVAVTAGGDIEEAGVAIGTSEVAEAEGEGVAPDCPQAVTSRGVITRNSNATQTSGLVEGAIVECMGILEALGDN